MLIRWEPGLIQNRSGSLVCSNLLQFFAAHMQFFWASSSKGSLHFALCHGAGWALILLKVIWRSILQCLFKFLAVEPSCFHIRTRTLQWNNSNISNAGSPSVSAAVAWHLVVVMLWCPSVVFPSFLLSLLPSFLPAFLTFFLPCFLPRFS